MAVVVGTNQQIVTAVAAADLSSSQYCAVFFSLSSGVLQCDVQGTAGGVADGILQNAPTSGQLAAGAGHRRVGRVFESATAAADFVTGYFSRDGII